ncbi:hypothetical protein [Micromonospora sp. C81]|uniref:hypothetical protein n=1 Tax=Micromonospora sp. C81 TaxID=2824881 RepID=UPI001B37DE47|nr:hypothetical protein [Micromonospora sp. C81]MBQ1035106.1 hypothetical protein [Micromonospora sp. C81]
MPNDAHLTGLDALLSETRQALESTRSRARGEAVVDDEEQPRGHGEALDGLVRAEVRGGRVDELVVAPRLMRLPAQDLTEHIRAAVNAALDDLDSQRPELPAAELDSLAGGLQEVQDRSLRQMAQMNEALQDVVALLREPRR